MRPLGHYILDEDHNVIPCEDLLDWAYWFKNADRVVKKSFLDTASADVEVSTVFMGIDHRIGRIPRLFETLVFGGALDGEMMRYASWNEAERGHDEMVRRVKDFS